MRKHKLAKQGEKITDLERYYLNGPVKQVMEIRYQAHIKNGEIIRGKIESDYASSETNYITTFNREGRVLFDEEYGTDNADTKHYDAAGHTVETLQYRKGQLCGTIKHVYSDTGKHLETISFDKDGALSWRSTNKYDDLGQNVESITEYTQHPQLYRKTVREYTGPILETNGIKHRNMASCIEYKADGSINYKTTKTFNADWKEIEDITEYTDEKQKHMNRHSTHKFNKQGDCIEMTIFNPDGTVKAHHTFTHEYDSEGKKIIPPHKPYDPFKLKPGETEEFVNDHHDNWIKKTMFFKKKPTYIYERQYSYYGEPSENEKAFIHPLTLVPATEKADASSHLEALEPEQAKWLAEGTPNGETFPMLRYYTMQFNEMPSAVAYSTSHVEAMALLKILEEKLGAKLIHSTGSVWNGYTERLTKYTLEFQSYPGYLLQATGISSYRNDEYDVPSHIEDKLDGDDYLYFSPFTLYRPGDNSKNRDESFEEILNESIDDCTIEKQPEKPFINIVETTSSGFTMEEYPVDDDFEIRDLDVNYGYGFQKFHDDLIQRFNKSTKGLVLFHGEPGTGKTYYIRHLLRKMVANNKVVIYMPPNMVDHLVEPAFMTFLASEVRNWSADGNFCVLLIEDAEPLLAKRQEGVRIQGVTNLLNLSDGLLNDMLNLQIICTFNVDLKKLDSALLRPGRLIARKEFKALGELDANLLASRLGIKHHFTGPATLSEIYSMRKNQNTLIHDVAPDRDASTILDDL